MRRRSIPIPFLQPGAQRRAQGIGFLPNYGNTDNASTGGGSAWDDYWGWGVSDWGSDRGGYDSGGGYYPEISPWLYDPRSLGPSLQYDVPQDPYQYETLFNLTTTAPAPLPTGPSWNWSILNPWLYDPGSVGPEFDYGIPPYPDQAAPSPGAPTMRRKPTPTSGTTRPAPTAGKCPAPWVYDPKTKKCVLPPCPAGYAYSLTQRKCVPLSQLVPADTVKEQFPWLWVVLIGTGLIIATRGGNRQ